MTSHANWNIAILKPSLITNVFHTSAVQRATDESEVLTVLCNGKTLAVGENLWSALYCLRYEDKPRSIWVDQRCINQEDLKERSSQVLMMGDIFRSAPCVLLSPGHLNQYTVTSSFLMLEICAKLGKKWYQDEDDFRRRLEDMAPQQVSQAFDIPLPKEPQWLAVNKFFRKPYLCRTQTCGCGPTTVASASSAATVSTSQK